VDKLSEQVQDFLTASALWEIHCAVNWLMWRLSESVLLLLNFHVDHYQLFVTRVPQFCEFLHEMHPFCNLFFLTVNEPQFHCTPTYWTCILCDSVWLSFFSGCVFLWPYIFAPPVCPNILDFSNFMYLLHKDSIGIYLNWCLVISIVFLMATSCYFLDFAISLHFKDFSIDVFDTRICIYLTWFMCVCGFHCFRFCKIWNIELYRVLRLCSSNGELNWSVDEKVSSPFELVFSASFKIQPEACLTKKDFYLIFEWSFSKAS
jgi:hypothetical protein